MTVCVACNEPIGNEAKVPLKEGDMHSRCFVCHDCKKQLAGISFHTEQEKRICEACFNANHAAKCGDCERILGSDTFFPVGDKKICSDCFQSKHAKRCCVCDKAITGQSTTANGKTFCPGCFKCHKCDKKIDGAFRTNADGKMEHSPNCEAACDDKHRKCKKCDLDLVNTKYFTLEDGSRVCCKCVYCKICGKNMDGYGSRVHIVKDWRIHDNCFKCAVTSCKKHLDDREIKLQGNDIVCRNCDA